MEDGGLLIYTNQPWHPQVEFIARVLTNREGNPWIMRRRSQAEMDALVRAAGFDHHLVKPLQPEALRKLLGRPPRGAEAGYENKPG